MNDSSPSPSQENTASCPHCAKIVTVDANFCPHCGKPLATQISKAPLTFKRLLWTFVAAVLVFSFSWTTQRSLAGTPPKNSIPQQQRRADNPQLNRLRAATQSSPLEARVWIALAEALLQSHAPGSALEMPILGESVEALRKALEIEPKNLKALGLLADLSFDQRAFTKAVDLYRRYLTLEPENHSIKAKLASAMAFLGQFDEAESALKEILSSHPQNFQAQAYLSITLAQKGEKEEALKIGKRALDIAPEPEARKRLAAFLDSLEREEKPAPEKTTTQDSTPKQQLTKYFKSHSITSRKFMGVTITEAGEAHVFMKDFPMSQMPPFAKERFFTNLQNLVKDNSLDDITTIVFFDQQSQQEMDRVEVALQK